MATPYKVTFNQLVPRPLEEVFAFFSRAENLEVITPQWLRFQVISVAPEPIQKGTLIEYRLKLHGLPLRWTSQIVEWDPPHKFVDLQVQGPYKLWRHTHLFIPEGGNTRICDEVLYSLPIGPLGRLAHSLFVRQDVERIFAFRASAVRTRFGQV
ncbi:MAG TPA: SRPBCC family protein [Verrucomicrobiae bacterium]|nr:SRPBCC family protein [Verrucomicrobiae bacterium]